ncbi:hypothetical protein 1 [Wuhan insect virus 26]|uniref:Capsid protein n=1 Tax=Wuhan insect virus 26 TaxID=1923730 RepID=A0A1L3KFB4_9VIRU|nr:hypothetical protein 1 [Wuhan insect virus 26]APG76047.1 hypothetical protein 1 [Wuhan insect virus 26]
MLASWLSARLYRDNKDTDNILRVKTSPYSDSHVICPLDREAEDHIHEIELGPPVDQELINGATWMLRAKDSYWNRPYVLHINGATTGQVEFYLSHVLGRKRRSALNYDVEIEGLNSRELYLDIVNGDGSEPGWFHEIPWTSPDILWSWTLDYVKLNRLEQAFAAAFETLAAVAIQPQWSSLEACAWQSSQIVVSFGAFSPTRARIRSNLTGTPYTPFAEASSFMLDEAAAPTHYFTAAAIANYYMWYGLYTLLHNEARTRNSWKTVFSSVADELKMLYTPMMRAACVSVITGREYASCMNHGAGMYIDMSSMYKQKYIGPLVPLDGTVGTSVEIEAIYAPVSGGLVLGTMTGEFETTAHLTGVRALECKGVVGKAFDLKELSVLATMYRLFGYELELKDYQTGIIKRTWAPVRDCVVDPATIEFDPISPRLWMIEGAQPREGRRHIIPTPQNLLSGEPVVIVHQKPTISVTKWKSRTKPPRPFIATSRVKAPVQFLIKAPFEYNPISFEAKEVPSHKFKLSDFQEGKSQVPPKKPEGQKILNQRTAEPAREEESIPTAGAAASLESSLQQ